MFNTLKEFVEYQLSLCRNHRGANDVKELYMHNAFGAVEWEGWRTGQDMTEFWEPYREQFEKSIWGGIDV